ncbi:MAG: UDP-3-O-(3-hydroxymyristoyl)glucosamine N-acyltransferase [Betaproteobacteria bacterium]
MLTTPQAIATLVNGRVQGDPLRPLAGLATLQAAGPDQVSFLSNPRYRAQLGTTRAGCVIVSDRVLPLADSECAQASLVVVDDPYLAYARLSQWWAGQRRAAIRSGVHPSAVVEPGARLHPSASVGPLCHVGANAVIEAGAVIGPHCVIGDEAVVGANSRLSASVSLLWGCRIGERAVVHPGVVIGADGFGFAPHAGQWVKIEQLGAVRIGHDVEIGANTCIDRGALEDTVIEDGVKLDNLIQIGHNVHIGRGSAMAGCVGIAGSATIGQRCTVGGGAIVLGHLSLADDVHISAATVVTRSIHKPGQYSGVFPFDDNAAWEKNAATLRQLHQMRDRLRQLEKKIPGT